MGSTLQQRLAKLNAAPNKHAITGIQRGIERETLRVKPDGKLALTPHPEALGAALTHPWITTDFSESLLEFITPVSDSLDITLAQLADIHRFTIKNIGDEQFDAVLQQAQAQVFPVIDKQVHLHPRVGAGELANGARHQACGGIGAGAQTQFAAGQVAQLTDGTAQRLPVESPPGAGCHRLPAGCAGL